MNQDAKKISVNTAIVGVLMLGYGWAFGLTGASDSRLYNLTVDLFNWMLRLGGLAMLVVAAVCYAGSGAGLLLDFLISGACGAVMLACGIFWLGRWVANTSKVPFDLQDLLVLVFGVVFARAALQSWSLYGAAKAPGPDAPGSKTAPADEPIHPASVRPTTLPADGQPPPPDGYLSALSREKEEPPTASYE